MSIVHLQNVEIVNPDARWSDPYILKITFECLSSLKEDIEWKLIYVGSAESEEYDQELDNCMVGPVPVGVNSFEFEAAAPSPTQIPASDLLGLTVILLTASYKDNEFVRVGYYVHNEYDTEELRENPPEKVDLSKVKREILVSKPRVTRLNIKWDEQDPSALAGPAGGAFGGSQGFDSGLGGSQAAPAAVPPPVPSMAARAAAKAAEEAAAAAANPSDSAPAAAEATPSASDQPSGEPVAVS